MKTITEQEYIDYLKLDDKIHKLIEEKTKQLSLIQYGIFPKGEYIECDLVDENGKLFVEFEYYQCGESCKDQFHLPLEFLFDESYPEKYKLIWEEEKRKKKEESERKRIEKEKRCNEEYENFERKEYERLKLKFERL